MSETKKTEVGVITWRDLTVSNAEEVKKIYEEIIGWTFEPVSMGDYDDYVMKSPTSDMPVAGICHARGTNKDIPPQWLIYITVEDIDKSSSRCVELGGKILVEPKSMGSYGRFCVIEDQSGAVAALFTPSK